MMPPVKAMSVPLRIGTYSSARALVRVKRGSMWITFAPRSFALVTKRKPTGWFSAKLEPWIRIRSACSRSIRNVVAPPRP